VLLTWEPGNGSAAVRSATDGTFREQILVMPKDRLGGRTLDATVAGVVVARAPLLVVRGTFQPGGTSGAFLVHH
jgi:hypothetical protein